MEQHRNCVVCRRGLYHNRYQRHLLTEDLPQTRPDFARLIQQNAILEFDFNNTRAVCHRCWQRIHADLAAQPAPAVQPAPTVQPDPAVQLDPAVHPDPAHQPERAEEPNPVIHMLQYFRAPNTARHCLFNNCQNEDRHRIPEMIKTFLLCEYKLYVPEHARICQDHLRGNDWDTLLDFCNVSHDFNADQMTNLCDMLIRAARRPHRLDFEDENALSNDEMHFWIGRDRNQFRLILEHTPSLVARCKRPKTALGIYLCKLRTGEPNERLATLFAMTRRTLEKLLKIARECLSNEYVSQHLGLDHMTRNEVIQRNLLLPKRIFGNEQNTQAILICDGTYIYIQKSSNFLFQRQSYSLHKFRNLLKPFIIVCTDGYILDVWGPFAATESDATIMSNVVKRVDHPLHWFLEENDVFILDRGFRDCIGDLQSCGYEAHMPPSKDRRATQLTTEQANKSRLVTICRWPVEIVNGRFKRDFKLLRQSYFNKTVHNMITDFKIASAILNHFHMPIDDHREADVFLSLINERLEVDNLLFNYVEGNNMNRRRVNFERMDATLQVQDFPQMTEDDIMYLALGSYHMKLAKSYCAEHLRDGLYVIETYRENELHDLLEYNITAENVWLLRGRIQSRHVRAKTYYCYILIDRNHVGRNAITQYYCTCLTGRRTVGTCAHIISMIWYLGVGRYQPFVAPAAFLNDVIVIDVQDDE